MSSHVMSVRSGAFCLDDHVLSLYTPYRSGQVMWVRASPQTRSSESGHPTGQAMWFRSFSQVRSRGPGHYNRSDHLGQVIPTGQIMLVMSGHPHRSDYVGQTITTGQIILVRSPPQVRSCWSVHPHRSDHVGHSRQVKS